MWTTMKNNLLGKKILSCSFCLYRFRKYVSYGFPIINFCNPGVHYETFCISVAEIFGHFFFEFMKLCSQCDGCTWPLYVNHKVQVKCGIVIVSSSCYVRRNQGRPPMAPNYVQLTLIATALVRQSGFTTLLLNGMWHISYPSPFGGTNINFDGAWD